MRWFARIIKSDIAIIIGITVVWRVFLFIPEFLGNTFLPQRSGYIGPIPWANFDGTHYLSIAKDGYFQYEHAFFPVFPMLIKNLEKLLRITYLDSALLIICVSLLLSLILLYKLALLDVNIKKARWAIIMVLSFPTSFFLTAVYSEGLFLTLSIASFYAARKKRWVIAGILGGLASATRVVGVFLFPALILEYLYQKKNKESTINTIKRVIKHAWGIFLIPFGLGWYMYYLHNFIGDAFAFIHSQFAFGANRSSGEIILLPQVLFRYANILLTIPTSNYDFWIALFELVMFSLVILFLITQIRKMRISYLVYSCFVVIIPTLSGTLSSEPRYVLAAFPIFIYLATIRNTLVKYTILVSGIIFEIILTSLFLRGYFVS